MNEAHEQAELIRKKYGYSGGADGSGFKIVGNNTVLPEAKDQSESINKIYDAQQKAKTDALKAAYDQNMADYDAQRHQCRRGQPARALAAEQPQCRYG